MMKRTICSGALVAIAVILCPLLTRAQRPPSPPEPPPPFYGPWNAVILPGGDGLREKLAENDPILQAGSPWTLLVWVNAQEETTKSELIAGIGAPDDEYPRYLAIAPGKVELYLGRNNHLEGSAAFGPGQWHLLAATFDGSRFQLFADGTGVGSATLQEPAQPAQDTAVTGLLLGSAEPTLEIAPAQAKGWDHFGGRIAGLELQREALTPEAIRQKFDHPIDFTLPVYEEGSKPWPVQTRGQAGYRAPQDPATMPHSKAQFSAPQAKPVPSAPAIESTGDNLWTLAGGWKLIAAPKVEADGAAIAEPRFDVQGWYAATVPGTVLTTLVDRGVYPDPYYGLNNLAIPETLNKQDYWYRTEFRGPATKGKHLTLTFEGINYRATVWLNGHRLGAITGAFIRGVFDVTGILKPGEMNVLAVRVSPPPHPGIPQEQSIEGGPGENGGLMCLDGPTFVATEGWDWIPGIRDRDTGIWQPVTLRATDEVKIGDPQVVTALPLPDTSTAKVEITVALTNASGSESHGTLKAEFEGASVTKEVALQPGENQIRLTPAEFAQLTVTNPRLWWPNGYGKQELYHLKLSFTEDGKISDVKEVRFGIREITYELSLLDTTGHLRRVGYSPTEARADAGPDVDVTHDGMRNIPPADPPPPGLPEAWRDNWHSWVASLTAAGEHSPAVRASDDLGTAPYLVIKVNGVRIACRGGNWGMDDAMKRVSRARLEPYFRLHHDAHENIIRNWVGQSTEETFYDLADEYGLLIWNDFWETTENYNIEAEDPALFLENARDVILRFRNHPSIAVWCGRNEGVPQPTINEGLANLIRQLDGTRYYSPSSNQVNLQNSGPYRYQDPKLYFTTLNHGFSVETGTPSFSTLEAFEASVPKPDQWPMDDVWAYHDWHFQGNGDMHPFLAEMQTEFGAPTSLADFERKVQMMDYVDHRAIFEGMNAHLWAPNSGRLLWMTQPAWPSNMWEVLSSDYDTQSSYYGEKKALEPLHVQLDLATDAVEVVNTTPTAMSAMRTTVDVFSLDNKTLLHKDVQSDFPADDVVTATRLELAPLEKQDVILVKLDLKDQSGNPMSSNLYWLTGDSRNFRDLVQLPLATVNATATATREGDQVRVHVELKNTGADLALQNKLTLVNSATGERILPAYYTDNYVSLLPGESRAVDVEYPASLASAAALTLRGFNLAQRSISIAGSR
jgi:Exo-beta-D-glucosaminidase Ig-fold domain/Glycosyl hydrolases family 2/Concanavalin A-like lectin/glucanases superfamily/Glycosyl hydrolases family 2, sugar binding domain/Glycosyl hydrolases family 2, TIM barrel domain